MTAVDAVHVLHTGRIGMPQRWIRVGGSDEVVEIPVLAFLVVAGDRLILVDTGCAPAVAVDPHEAWGRLSRLYHAHVTRHDLVDERIRLAGHDPADVTDVVLTHLHMDHVGGLQLVSHATVWLQRAEYRWGQCPDDYASGGYFRKEYDLPDLDLQFLDGDGAVAPGVRCILTDGHTPGHQSVLITTRTGRLCVVGDAVYNRTSYERRSLPAVAWETGRYMASLERLRTLEEYFGARLLFSHDMEQAGSFPPEHVPLA